MAAGFRDSRHYALPFSRAWVAFMALVAISAVQLHATSFKEVTKLAADCKNNDTNACEKLDQIAAGDKNYYVRAAAIGQITDQPLLAQLAIAEKSDENAYQAVKEITDQSQLTEVAIKATWTELRQEAAGRVVNKEMLTRLVSASNDSAVRGIAQEELDWVTVDSIGTATAYAGFLEKYPHTNRLEVESDAFTVDHFRMVSFSNSVSAGPNGEIVPTDFNTTVVCDVMKDALSLGDKIAIETITVDEAEKRGFVTRDPKTHLVTAKYKLVQTQFYKLPKGASYSDRVLAGDPEVQKEPDR